MRIGEPELTAMQRRDRRRQAQSKTGTRLGAAGFEPDKSFHRVLAIGLRNSGPMVGDAKQHLIAVATGLDQNHLAFAAGDRISAQRLRDRRLAVFDSILDEVRQRLADQFAVAVKPRRRS